MADEAPYARMKQWQRDMTPAQRLPLYNLRPYRDESHPQPNFWGLGEGGQHILWQAALADQLACREETKVFRDMVVNHLAGDNGWTKEGAAVAYVSASSFAVPGQDVTGVYKPGRALSAVQQATAFGYVVSAEYDVPNNRTVVTVEGVTLDAGIHEVWLGQDPANAPKVEDPTGSDLYLADLYCYHGEFPPYE